MIPKLSIIQRALLKILYVLLMWAACGTIAVMYLMSPLTIFLFSSFSIALIYTSGLLLLLPPATEKNMTDEKRQSIISEVCSEFGCSFSDITGSSKKQALTDARGVLIYLIRKHLRDNFTTIGRYLNRDHTTIIHLLNRTNDLIFTKERPIEASILRIESKLLIIQK